MKRLSVVGLSLSMMLGSQMAKASQNSSLWDDMLMHAYGAPDDDNDQDQGQAAQEQGNAKEDDDQDQEQGQAAQEQQEQQEQQDQSAAQETGKGAKFGFGHTGDSNHNGGGSDANVTLNPNLAGLKYFVGTWDCNATVLDPNGDTVQFNKSVQYKPAFGGNWLGSAWSKSGHSFNHKVLGAGAETFNPYTQQFVKVAVGACGGYGYSTSSGWTGSEMVWAGEGWNWGPVDHGYSQVTISQVSDSSYTVKIAGSLDGTSYSTVGNATCTKSTHTGH